MSVLPLDAADEVATEPVPPTQRRGVPALPAAAGRPFWASPGWSSWSSRRSPRRCGGPTRSTSRTSPTGWRARPAAHWLGTDPNGRDILSRIFTAGARAAARLDAHRAGRLRHRHPAGADGRPARPADRAGDQPAHRDRHGAARRRSCCWPSSASSASRSTWSWAILGVLISAVVYRIMLGVAQSVRQRLYVDAARVNGLGLARGQPAARAAGAWPRSSPSRPRSCSASRLLIQSGLAFLGFGPAEPEPSWGVMIQDASQHIYDAPWLMVPTGLVLALTVVAANELADAIAGKATAEKPVPTRRTGPRRGVEHRGAGRPRRRPRGPRPVGRRWTTAPPLVTGVSFALQPGPGARPGRRVRLRQDDDRPLAAGPAPGRRLGVRRLDPLAGPRAGRPVGAASSTASAAARSR